MHVGGPDLCAVKSERRSAGPEPPATVSATVRWGSQGRHPAESTGQHRRGDFTPRPTLTATPHPARAPPPKTSHSPSSRLSRATCAAACAGHCPVDAPVYPGYRGKQAKVSAHLPSVPQQGPECWQEGGQGAPGVHLRPARASQATPQREPSKRGPRELTAPHGPSAVLMTSSPEEPGKPPGKLPEAGLCARLAATPAAPEPLPPPTSSSSCLCACPSGHRLPLP